ncbi:MAG: hypothetical protein LBJ76_01385 [Candidatus Accumulibacter sp.]|jgi:hypothetical protein|nr:hypothetical protein [Accumulibacter sp.]
MGGLLVLALIFAYVILTSKLFKRVRPWWAKALVIVAAILIPTADAVYGRHKLKRMCEAEGGLHIYRVAEGVDGFDDASITPHDEWILKYGYRIIEGTELNGKRSRLVRLPNGKIVRETGIKPMTEYIYEIKKINPYSIFIRDGSHVRVRSTGEILSREVNINYSGGWLERFVNGLYSVRGTAGMCGSIVSKHELIAKTLKPLKQEKTK